MNTRGLLRSVAVIWVLWLVFVLSVTYLVYGGEPQLKIILGSMAGAVIFTVSMVQRWRAERERLRRLEKEQEPQPWL